MQLRLRDASIEALTLELKVPFGAVFPALAAMPPAGRGNPIKHIVEQPPVAVVAETSIWKAIRRSLGFPDEWAAWFHRGKCASFSLVRRWLMAADTVTS